MRPRLVHLSSLLHLQNLSTDESNPAKQILGRIIHASLPLGLNGLPPVASGDDVSLTSLIAQASARWARRLDNCSADIDVSSILSQDRLDADDMKILSALVYTSPAARQACYDWLSRDTSLDHPVDVAPLLHATLDVITTTSASNGSTVNASEVWFAHFSRFVRDLVRAETWVTVYQQLQIVDCVVFMVSHFSGSREQLAGILRRTLEKASLDMLSVGVVRVARQMLEFGAGCEEFAIVCMDHGLQYASRHFANDEALNAPIIRELGEFQKLLL